MLPQNPPSFRPSHAMTKILFVTSNRIGDAILSSGVLDHYPDARITIAAGPLSAPLFADYPKLERLYQIVKKPGCKWCHWLELWQATRKQHWDVIIDLRSLLFAWTLRANHRLGCHGRKQREHRIIELQRNLSLEKPPSPKLWLSEERISWARKQFAVNDKIIAIGPIANWLGKQWPIERFIEVARHITGPDGFLSGARIAVFAAPHERIATAPLLEAFPPSQIYDFTSLPHLLDVFALLQRCNFYIGNDSGLMHMAAAADIPVLGLFGPSEDWRYAPWGEKSSLVRTQESYEELTEKPGFDFSAKECLMGNLSVSAVIEAASDLWRRENPPFGKDG